jgi:rare lipoprotein A
MIRIVALGILALALAAGPAPAQQTRAQQAGAQQTAAGPNRHRCQCTVGTATWYGAHAQGRRTAGGERFDRQALTAAHRTLPFNSRVRVTNLRNGRSVVVRITDRGPFGPGRVIDVSEAAARELDMVKRGIARVRIERIGENEG